MGPQTTDSGLRSLPASGLPANLLRIPLRSQGRGSLSGAHKSMKTLLQPLRCGTDRPIVLGPNSALGCTSPLNVGAGSLPPPSHPRGPPRPGPHVPLAARRSGRGLQESAQTETKTGRREERRGEMQTRGSTAPGPGPGSLGSAPRPSAPLPHAAPLFLSVPPPLPGSRRRGGTRAGSGKGPWRNGWWPKGGAGAGPAETPRGAPGVRHPLWEHRELR